MVSEDFKVTLYGARLNRDLADSLVYLSECIGAITMVFLSCCDAITKKKREKKKKTNQERDEFIFYIR